ncbi:MAG: hypothetical protein IBJ11_12100 [Phycisphaerales bacterium]|nr:hypothetical protein [Phycisphaerales bacterium]
MRTFAFILMLGLLAASCAAPPARTTRLRASDFEVSAAEMAQSLAASEWLAGRTAASEPARVVTNKVENLTTDVITPAEQWMVVARAVSALPITELGRAKNISFQLPPERVADLRAAGFPTELAPEDRATHVMTATFRSSTRLARLASGLTDARKEYYQVEYRLTDVRTRELKWTGLFEFAREARGKLVD